MRKKLSVAACTLGLLCGAVQVASAAGDIYKIIQDENISAFSEMMAQQMG